MLLEEMADIKNGDRLEVRIIGRDALRAVRARGVVVLRDKSAAETAKQYALLPCNAITVLEVYMPIDFLLWRSLTRFSTEYIPLEAIVSCKKY